jgi:hypothetical protein
MWRMSVIPEVLTIGAVSGLGSVVTYDGVYWHP